jgi:FlaA1/EpsC-like NDP-sugar epimerase
MAIIPKLERKRKINILVVGAGEAGKLVLGEIKSHPTLNFEIIGFIDDDSKKQNKNIEGVRVLGKVADIPQIVKSKHIDEIIIAIPSAGGMQNRRIINKCQESKVPFRIIPGIYEMLKQDTDAGSLREVELEDLIKRKPVNFDLESIQLYLTNKIILVSGAAGSIGRELCRQIIKFYPKKLLLFDQEENSLNEVFTELKGLYPNFKVIPIIGNICDRRRVRLIFGKYKPDVVFHSAAYKHVPMMELNVSECIKNNVFGTLNVIEEASRKNAECFIFISTDKAINPTSIMGVSKRIAEMITLDASSRSKTKFSVVRFGNVLVSRGSVIPLFEKQIRNRQAVTVTHKKMRRYFMTLSEAAQLVIQVGALTRGGEIFVLDMGKPVSIVRLAKEMIRLSGLRPDKDIPIVYTGIRPGERLYEPLFSFSERIKLTKHKRIFIAPSFSVNHKKLFSCLKRLKILVNYDNKNKIIREINNIVPNYKEIHYDEKASDNRWKTS